MEDVSLMAKFMTSQDQRLHKAKLHADFRIQRRVPAADHCAQLCIHGLFGMYLVLWVHLWTSPWRNSYLLGGSHLPCETPNREPYR